MRPFSSHVINFVDDSISGHPAALRHTAQTQRDDISSWTWDRGVDAETILLSGGFVEMNGRVFRCVQHAHFVSTRIGSLSSLSTVSRVSNMSFNTPLKSGSVVLLGVNKNNSVREY